MQDNNNIISVNKNNINILEQFLSNAGNSLNTFRYYNKRDVSIIEKHVCTYIILEDSIPVGYGHLDKEDDTVWLGIAISEVAKGKGYGKKMIEELISTAEKLKVKKINLSVDSNNDVAIRLYKKYGFEYQKNKDNVKFFQKTIIK